MSEHCVIRIEMIIDAPGDTTAAAMVLHVLDGTVYLYGPASAITLKAGEALRINTALIPDGSTS